MFNFRRQLFYIIQTFTLRSFLLILPFLLIFTYQKNITQAATNPYPLCSNGANCTWYAWERWHEWGEDLPAFGNAKDWASAARSYGYNVGNQPELKAIAVFQPGVAGASTTFGHVAIVEAVNGDFITISEQNCDWTPAQNTRTIYWRVSGLEFIYFPTTQPMFKLKLSETLSLSTTNPQQGDAVTARFKVKNVSGQTLNLRWLTAVVRLNETINRDMPSAENLVLGPEQEYTYEVTWYFSEVGNYYVTPWSEINGEGGNIEAPPRINFTVSAGPGKLFAMQALNLSTTTPVYSQSIQASFRVRNTGGQALTISCLQAAVYLPLDNSHPDFPCINLTLQPQQDYNYQQPRNFTTLGNYQSSIWAKINGNWQAVKPSREVKFRVYPEIGQNSNYAQNFIKAYNGQGGAAVLGMAEKIVQKYPNTGVDWQPLSSPIPRCPNSSAGIYHDIWGGTNPSDIRALAIVCGMNEYYTSIGGPASWLGAPTSEEYSAGNNIYRVSFLGGYITWDNGTFSATPWPTNFNAWKATYYNNMTLASGPALVRNEGDLNSLNFSYAFGSDQVPIANTGVMYAYYWSARWQRNYNFGTGTYRFKLCGDDGARLYLSNVLVINHWQNGSKTCFTYDKFFNTNTVAALKIEYYQHVGDGQVSFTVLKPGEFPPGPVTYNVTNPTDQGVVIDGSKDGTLSYALQNANGGEVISFALNSGNTVSVKNGLPPLRPGVTISAPCNNGPTIRLDRSGAPAGTAGLTLSGNNVIQGLRISGFGGQLLKILAPDNKFYCTIIAR